MPLASVAVVLWDEETELCRLVPLVDHTPLQQIHLMLDIRAEAARRAADCHNLTTVREIIPHMQADTAEAKAMRNYFTEINGLSNLAEILRQFDQTQGSLSDAYFNNNRKNLGPSLRVTEEKDKEPDASV